MSVNTVVFHVGWLCQGLQSINRSTSSNARIRQGRTWATMSIYFYLKLKTDNVHSTLCKLASVLKYPYAVIFCDTFIGIEYTYF